MKPATKKFRIWKKSWRRSYPHITRILAGDWMRSCRKGKASGINGLKKGYVVLTGKKITIYNGRVLIRSKRQDSGFCEIVALPRFPGPDEIEYAIWDTDKFLHRRKHPTLVSLQDFCWYAGARFYHLFWEILEEMDWENWSAYDRRMFLLQKRRNLFYWDLVEGSSLGRSHNISSKKFSSGLLPAPL